MTLFDDTTAHNSDSTTIVSEPEPATTEQHVATSDQHATPPAHADEKPSAAGEDFAKLQQEAYDVAGNKTKASNPRVENARKSSIPPTDAAIFDLKKGEVSQVFDDPGGLTIYKVEEVKDLPVASVHDEIARTLQGEKMKGSFESLQNSVKTTLNDAYFATPAPPTLKNPGETSAPETPAPGKK